MDSKFITTTDVELHVVEGGSKKNPSILFLHGFPDDHTVWSAQLSKLEDRYHVIAMDLRGVGQSTLKIEKSGAYQISAILEDIKAVLDDTLAKNQKVHLVGHDWGSIIGWYALQDDTLQKRIASFTSISGPHIGVAVKWVKEQLQSFQPAKVVRALKQIGASSYIGLFNLPFIERTFKLFPKQWAFIVAKLGGLESSQAFIGAADDAVLSNRFYLPVELYRQNLKRYSELPEYNSIKVPVQLIVPSEDTFLQKAMLQEAEAYVAQIKTVTITANHWVLKTHPEEVSGLIANFINEHTPVAKPTAKKATAKKKTATKDETEQPEVESVVAAKSKPKKAAPKKAAARKSSAKKTTANSDTAAAAQLAADAEPAATTTPSGADSVTATSTSADTANKEVTPES